MTYSPSLSQPQRPKRPIGVAALALFGMLVGGLYALCGLILFVVRLMQGLPFVPLLIATGIGLLLAWIVIYLYMGLWDLVRWAWWLHIVLHLLAAIGSGLALSRLGQFQVQVAKVLPANQIQPVMHLVNNVLLANLVICGVIVVYLIAVHKAFRIGMPDERPIWEH